jgi:hypothetical protein
MIEQDLIKKLTQTDEESSPMLNRVEDKYFVSSDKVQELTAELTKKLKNGDIDSGVRYTINKTVYLDNRDLHSFRDGLDSVKPRFKIRIRQYSPNGKAFEDIAYLEMKEKTEDGLSKKIRVRIPAHTMNLIASGFEIEPNDSLFSMNNDIAPDIFWKYLAKINGIITKYGFREQLVVEYERRAFSDGDVRVTIDTGLHYHTFRGIDEKVGDSIINSENWKHKSSNVKKLMDKDYCIVEVKHTKDIPSWLKDKLKEVDAQEVDFSKYCGAITTFLINGNSIDGRIQKESNFNMNKLVNFFRKLDDIMNKGGPGSGVKGHQTADKHVVLHLTRKLHAKLDNDYHTELQKLKNNPVFENIRLESGKPVFSDIHEATKHGYTPEDFREAMNVFHTNAQKLSEQKQKLETAKQPVPESLPKLIEQNNRMFRRHFSEAQRLEHRTRATDMSIKDKKELADAASNVKHGVKKSIKNDKTAGIVNPTYIHGPRPDFTENVLFSEDDPKPIKTVEKESTTPKRTKRYLDSSRMMNSLTAKLKDNDVEKSVTSMGHNDGLEVNTASYAKEREEALESGWLQKLQDKMAGFKYGDLPVEVDCDKGKLFLVMVDDGVYSGFFRKDNDINDPYGLEDTAKVRIERHTLPTLVNLLMAKEFINPVPKEKPVQVQPNVNEVVSTLNTKLEEPKSEPINSEISNLDTKLAMLNAIEKLLRT